MTTTNEHATRRETNYLKSIHQLKYFTTVISLVDHYKRVLNRAIPFLLLRFFSFLFRDVLKLRESPSHHLVPLDNQRFVVCWCVFFCLYHLSTFDIEIKMDLNFSMFIVNRYAINRFICLTTFRNMKCRYACCLIDFCFKFNSFSNFNLSFIPNDTRKRISINNNFCKCRLTCTDEIERFNYI